MNTLKELLMTGNPVERLRAMIQHNTLEAFEPTLSALDMDRGGRPIHKNVLDHSLRVLDNAISREKNGADLILRTAALFHDIGKPATRRFERGGVTFDGHEVVGAKMMPTILRRHGYSGSEIKEIKLLVLLHMRSHGFENGHWTDSALRRILHDAGTAEAFDRLVVIFYADATTKSDSKLRKIHRSVDNLSLMAEKVKAEDARKSLRPALDGTEVMELLNLTPGRELGGIMKMLNSDEHIGKTREEVVALLLG